MSTALRAADNRLALREVARLNINKILDMREAWNDAAFELHSARNSLRFFLSEPVRLGKRLRRKEYIHKIRQTIAACERRLSDTPKLPLLGMLQQQNEEELIDTLQLLVIGVVKFYITTEKMDEGQIYEAAFRIMNEFKGLTLEDVALCFYEAQNGVYGEVYNRIDAPVIMSWLHKYQDRMRSLGMSRELQRHVNSKGADYRSGSEYRIMEPRTLRNYLE